MLLGMPGLNHLKSRITQLLCNYKFGKITAGLSTSRAFALVVQ